MLLCLIGFATACFDSDNGSGGLSPEPKDSDAFQDGENSLIGEWYEVSSTENLGTKVIFTEKTVTAFGYAKDYKIPDLDTVINGITKFYDNANYTIISEDVMKLQHYPRCPEILEHKVTFTLKSNDTLWIDSFFQIVSHRFIHRL